MDEQQYLDQLTQQYLTPVKGCFFECQWEGYVTGYSVKDRMAQTTCSRYGDIYHAGVTMSRAFDGWKPLTQRAVLYHEFCHAEAWYEEQAKGHTDPWIKRWLRKPVLSLVGAFTSTFWFIKYQLVG